jgi:HPt (histidine-containing phosphotransfer) domain-containing protein
MTAAAAHCPENAAAIRIREPIEAPDYLLNAKGVEELRAMGTVVVDRILPRYVRNAAEAGAAIVAAAGRGDLVEVARLAHKLRGSSGTLAGVRLPAACAALEEAAEEGDLATVTTIVRTLPGHVAATCEALRVALS